MQVRTRERGREGRERERRRERETERERGREREREESAFFLSNLLCSYRSKRLIIRKRIGREEWNKEKKREGM